LQIKLCNDVIKKINRKIKSKSKIFNIIKLLTIEEKLIFILYFSSIETNIKDEFSYEYVTIMNIYSLLLQEQMNKTEIF